MPDLLVRDVEEADVIRLKERAKAHGRSLGAELRIILEQAAKQVAMTTARAQAEEMTESLRGRTHTDSAQLLREDRGR
jgi:plasmid stability protein